jgi:hypothetical protein
MNFLQAIMARLKAGLKSLSPTCRDASQLQSEVLDHPLPPVKKLGLWLHLRLCKWCRRYGRQIRFLRQAAHEHPDEFAQVSAPKLSGAARERIIRQLRNEK